MRCPSCGNENSEPLRFCTSCGKPLSADASRPEQSVAPLSQAASGRRGLKRSTKIVVGVVACLLIAGAAAAGFITWLVLESNRPTAEILSMSLARTDGDTLDLEEVPLDTELTLKVRYRASFDESGRSLLRLTVASGDGEKMIDKTYELESSGEARSTELEFSMTRGSGKPVKAKAVLAVDQGKTELRVPETLTFTVVEGKGEEVLFEEAQAAALSKCEEATAAVKDLAALNISASDLADRLSRALEDLDDAETSEEANAVYQDAQEIVDECAARRAAAADEQSRLRDVEAAKQVMYDYAYAEKGNAESIELVDSQVNEERTRANATYRGMVTVHTDPDNAGQTNYYYVTAVKRNGQWVVTDFSYEFVQ
jgi:hypothetical protein